MSSQRILTLLILVSGLYLNGCASTQPIESYGGECNLRVLIHEDTGAQGPTGKFQVALYQDNKRLDQRTCGKTGPAWFRKVPEGDFQLYIYEEFENRPANRVICMDVQLSPGLNQVNMSRMEYSEYPEADESRYWIFGKIVEGTGLVLGGIVIVTLASAGVWVPIYG